MGITTIYECDKCGREKTSSGNFWEITITKKPVHDRSSIVWPFINAMWCRPCVVSVLGALPKQKDDPPPPDSKPSIEDMIREIVQEEVQ